MCVKITQAICSGCVSAVYLWNMFQINVGVCVCVFQVKVWNTNSGLCFVTFTEHTSSVTNVTFNSSGFVVVSASLDGTVRAFDLHRYCWPS